MKYKIVHITAHMGAGAGKAISGIALNDKNNSYEILLLNKPDKLDHLERCRKSGISVYIKPPSDVFDRIIALADVVVINWWNHPSVYDALLKIEKEKTRIIVWNHINGLQYPRLKGSFLNAYDFCMFTSKASLQIEYWTDEDRKKINQNSKIVYGMGDFSPGLFKPKENYCIDNKVKVGYVGSLDYSKLHPDFIYWIKRITAIDDRVQFFLAGDVLQDIAFDVVNENLENKISFLGYRNDIPELLREFDVFVYPLNPNNFATTENAIIEAMAVGLPIISTRGIVEESIITDGKTGILVKNVQEFLEAFVDLVGDKDKRQKLGKNARENAINTYSISDNVHCFQESVEKVMSVPKHEHVFSDIIGTTPHEWLFNGCSSEEISIFLKLASEKNVHEIDDTVKGELSGLAAIFWGESKGSVEQFLKFNQNDELLLKIQNIMKKQRRKR